MISHTCPICGQAHEVREARVQLAYGRQLTCSPDCESERRKRMRLDPFPQWAAEQCAPTARESQRSAARRETLPWLTNPPAGW